MGYGTVPSAGARRFSSRRFGALVAAALLLSSAGGIIGGVVTAAASTPGSVLGVYAGPASPDVVAAVGTAVGHQPTYAMEFLDGSSWSTISDPSWFLGQWQGSGFKMIWGVEMIPNSGGTLAQGATGAYDSYFATLARNLVAGGQGSSIIRLGWEFNGGWFPWAAGGHGADFIAYWKHIVTAMRSAPGAAFRFEWNPNRGDLGVGDLATYYPGDGYVDVIGMDVYDTEWASYPGAQAEWQTMQTQAYGLNWLAQFAGQHGKPISFPEWGLGWGPSAPNSGPVQSAGEQVSGGDDPTFITNMSHWIASHNVDNAVFWDYGTSTILGGSNPQTTAALAAGFGTGVAPNVTPTPPPTPTTTVVTSPSTTAAPSPAPPTTGAPANPPTTGTTPAGGAPAAPPPPTTGPAAGPAPPAPVPPTTGAPTAPTTSTTPTVETSPSTSTTPAGPTTTGTAPSLAAGGARVRPTVTVAPRRRPHVRRRRASHHHRSLWASVLHWL